MNADQTQVFGTSNIGCDRTSCDIPLVETLTPELLGLVSGGDVIICW